MQEFDLETELTMSEWDIFNSDVDLEEDYDLLDDLDSDWEEIDW